MRRIANLATALGLSITFLWLPFLLHSGLSAADERRDVRIDKTNWENIEGLVPNQIVEWIKKGDFFITQTEMEHNPWEFFPDFAKQSFKENTGKYALSERDVVVEASTGKTAEFLIGFPFPEIDPNDPQAAVKIMFNKQYLPYVMGFKRFSSKVAWLSRSGFERDVEVAFLDASLTGFPGAEKYPNPQGLERMSILSVRKPYDLAGTSVMLWRYFTERADMNFSYVPAIRRVRRMSPANRSDGFLGSDFCVDDIVAYDGKVPAFEWKIVGKQDALVAYVNVEPVPVVPYERGGWMISEKVRPIRYGFHEKDSKVAPWCPLDLVFVKRPVWVVEARSKDPYYNYGTQQIWLDTELYTPVYKLVYDRTGEYWKTLILGLVLFESEDKTTRFLGALDHIIVDEKRQHATYLPLMDPTTRGVYFADIDINDFTLAGFQKYCK